MKDRGYNRDKIIETGVKSLYMVVHVDDVIKKVKWESVNTGNKWEFKTNELLF